MSDFKCPMCTDCPHNCPLEDRDIDTRIGSADWKVGYSQGKADAFMEIAYSDSVKKEPFEVLAYQKGRADVVDEFVSEIKKHHYLLCNKNNSTDYGMFTCGLEQIANELKEVE